MAGIGRLRRLAVHDGYYVYLGSMLGPGGLRGRIDHHLRVTLAEDFRSQSPLDCEFTTHRECVQ